MQTDSEATARAPEVAPTREERVVVLCGSRHDGEPDGILDYSEHFVAALRERVAHVELIVVRADDRIEPAALRGADTVVVQYNPFSFGHRGIAPRLLLALRRARRRGRPRVAVMMHERYLPPLHLKWRILGTIQRVQLKLLLSMADSSFASIQEWAQGPARHLPVASNLPEMCRERSALRRELAVGDDDVVLAAFGTGHPSRRLDLVARAANAVAAAGHGVKLLNIGSGAPPIEGLAEGIEVHTPGFVTAERAACLISAADLYLAPFVDGVSTRRTTVMAALQHGVAVLGTRGENTDAVLEQEPGIVLTAHGDAEAFASAAGELVGDLERLRELGAGNRRFYEREFDWPVLMDRFIEAQETHRSR